MRLEPGRYDFSSLPLLAGSNDIDIEVRDNTGSVQALSFQQYLDPIDLEPGDYEYGAYFGPMSERFGGAPDYRGPLAFTGFFRKAFFNRPAIGGGLQVSEDVQTLTGQTQFVLPRGGRLLLDGGASNSETAGQGFAAGASYEQYLDRGGLADNFSVRADYLSNGYATLGNPDAIHSTSVSFSAQYTRQFSFRFLTTASGSYLKGRGTSGDSYRIGLTGHYRLDRRWSIRAGVDYAKYPSAFSSGNGFSVNVGLVFQPDYRRRAEARYESRNNLAELSYSQSGLNELNSVGFGGVVAHQDDNARAQGYGYYSANRFDASVSHSSYGPSFNDFGVINATSARIGTTIAFADEMIGIGRRINDSFILLSPHENLGDRSVVAGQSLAQNDYIGRSGPLGAAVNNFLGSYVTQSVQYDVEDPPAGYDVGPGIVRVHPAYKSGYALRVGTDAFVSAMGTLVRGPDAPVALIGGRVTLLDVEEGENPQPIPFFTNSVGRFAIASLLPGRRYLVETYGPNGTIDRSFEFSIPADSDGLVDLGTVRPGTAN
jgi:outer membrane usher protein